MIGGAIVVAGVVIAAAIVLTQSETPDPSPGLAVATSPSSPAEQTSPPSQESFQSVEPVPQTLEVVDYGFSVDTQYGDRTVTFAVIVRNPSVDRVLEQSVLDVEFTSPSGIVVASTEVYPNYIQPEQRGAITGVVTLEGKASEVRMSVEPRGQADWASGSFPRGSFIVSDVKIGYEYGSPRVTATIESTFDVSISDVLVQAIFYNSRDEIIGGYFTFKRLGAGSKTVVAVEGLYDAPDLARAEIFAAPSNLSSFR